jgi:demethylmenaquinone methyltransferase / 2-methoxy-6-polyprenyl-1,4-benzoquinol methylase
MLIGIRTALAPFFPLGYDATMASKDTKTSHSSKAEKTHFGFSTVNAIDKAKMVKGVFDNVASQYDLMNDLMSLGIHRLWKSAFIDYLDPHPQMKLIDVGGGTGDIAFKFLNSGGGHVTVCDINQEMLNVGQDRAINKGLLAGIDWINGDAEKLPMLGNTFDAYTTAFCIRNVTNIESALSEAHRVLKPGGHFLCLEFSQVVLPFLKKVYDSYSLNVLPWLGKMVADDEDSYRYLVESIRRFPDQGKLTNMIKDAGLKQANYQNLSGGIATIHSAWRI